MPKEKVCHAHLELLICDEVVTQEALEAYDFVNVMVYDKTGIWRPDVIGPHSPFSFAEDAIKYYTVDRKLAPSTYHSRSSVLWI